MTDAERTVSEAISREGVHVVHVWAPWCDNSLNEHGPVWQGFAARHPDASLTFVTVWNEGASGADRLGADGIAAAEVVVPGPKPEKADRRMTFLGLPVTWIPTTWVFNRGGLLAYAFNYGELSADELARAIEAAGKDW